MGNTIGLDNEQLLKLKKESSFSETELKRIYRRFKKLDTDKSGTLSAEEFKEIEEFKNNPLLDRFLAVLDENHNNEIEFSEFIMGLSVFSKRGNKDQKLRFTFDIYDIDGDGFISNRELFQVLKVMVGSNLKDEQLQQIVDKTILFADTDGDGLISFEEYKELIEHIPNVEQQLTISFDDPDGKHIPDIDTASGETKSETS